VETAENRLLIDCGPDFRQQILPQPFRKIDAILVTHAHYDHMGGMDDIRPYCQFGEINVYADAVACQGMLEMLPYCFAEHRYPGVPAIGLHEIKPHKPLTFGDLEVIPFVVMHGKLPILAYRIGDLAYITDMKTIDESEMDVTGSGTLRFTHTGNLSSEWTVGAYCAYRPDYKADEYKDLFGMVSVSYSF
jgi:phosphoribosyl 1,2-cyclic phosphate phosphodiesterase